ncbi:MAG: hypothetical protein HJJLKODD_00845 [Phycisphaerae bacterium]|nr:hypothetical protein [Phycisphaerae bacterium]
MAISLLAIAVLAQFDSWTVKTADQLAADGTWLRTMLKLSTRFFDTLPIILIGGVLLLYPARWRLLTGYALVLASNGLLVQGIKYLVGRARPELGQGATHFEPFSGLDAFPSGHTANAIAITLLMMLYWPRSGWVFFPLAIMTGLSRIVQQRHFLSDVLCGALLATLCYHLLRYRLGTAYFFRLDYWPPLLKQRFRRSASSPPTA